MTRLDKKHACALSRSQDKLPYVSKMEIHGFKKKTYTFEDELFCSCDSSDCENWKLSTL